MKKAESLFYLALMIVFGVFIFNVFVDLSSGRLEMNPDFDYYGPLAVFYVLFRWTFWKPVFWIIFLVFGISLISESFKKTKHSSSYQNLGNGILGLLMFFLSATLFFVLPPLKGGIRNWERTVCEQAKEVTTKQEKVDKLVLFSDIKLRSQILVWDSKKSHIELEYSLSQLKPGCWANPKTTSYSIIIIEDCIKSEAGQWVSKKIKDEMGISANKRTGYETVVKVSVIDMPELHFQGQCNLIWKPSYVAETVEMDYLDVLYVELSKKFN